MQGASKQGSCACKVRYAFAICLVCLFTFNAKGLGQPENITLKANNIAFFEVFKTIYKQTKLKVSYSNLMFNDKERVSVNFMNTPIQEVMTSLLKGKDVSFTLTENLIIINKKEKETSNASLADTIIGVIPTVSGKVTDAQGRPIPGTSISIKGTNYGASTDANGNFTLTNVKKNSTMLVSSIGFEPSELQIKGSSVLIELNVEVSQLDETVVIAYGTTTRRLSTGNINTVKEREIEKQPVNNPLLALQGRVPGLLVTQSTGVPGGGLTVRIQGQNSLSRGNDPLYVIDGVPYVSQMLPNLSGPSGILGDNGNTNSVYAPGGSGNPLAFLNPADIASIDILKDADATSIYGSRAAAGAILITTKRGQPGKTKVDINVRQGWGQITRKLKLLDTRQYLQMRHEAKLNDNADLLPTDYDINGTWDTTRYTDWQKLLIGGTAHFANGQASVSGGSANTQFLLNAGYTRETSVFIHSLADRKGSLHFNINHTSNNQKFRLQLSGNYLVDDNKLINTDLTNIAIRLAPNAPALYNPDGTLNWAPIPEGSSWYNPLAYLRSQYNLKINNLTSSAVLSYEIIPGLSVKASLGYNDMRSDEVSTNPLDVNAPEVRSFMPRFSNFSNGHIQSYIVEPQVSYRNQLAKGVLDVLVGATFLENNSNQQQFNATGFNSDLVMEDIRAASAVSVTQSIASIYRYNAVFGRINYNWENKYIFSLTARRDGSSRFGPQNLFHNFGSIAGAWIISSEDFFKKGVPFISFTKLRASYGTTGNDQIGEYQFMNLYSPVGTPVAYQGAPAILPAGLSNPYLQWEETKKLQIGFDFGVLEDRILLNVNYYRNRSSNQLHSYELPSVGGFTSVQRNFPAIIQNTGWEISLNTVNFNQNNFTWSSSANLTIARNKLVAYPDLENSAYANTYVIGEPITNAAKYFQFAAVDATTGLFTFITEDGHITSEPVYPQDLLVLKADVPSFYGGFQNNFRYKGFELDLLFQFVRQEGLNYKMGVRPGLFRSRNDGILSANQPVSVLDRWQKPGDEKSFQKFSAQYPSDVFGAYANATLSSLAFSDASYIRLKNIHLSWQIPDRWRKAVSLTDGSVYIQGQNLITWTNYIGLDPETRNTLNIPPLKVWTIGARLSF